MTLEEAVQEFTQNMCNVELLCNVSSDGTVLMFGARIRPWDKDNKDMMILGKGTTVAEAVFDAMGKAGAGRWERLDYAKRPWSDPRPAASWKKRG